MQRAPLAFALLAATPSTALAQPPLPPPPDADDARDEGREAVEEASDSPRRALPRKDDLTRSSPTRLSVLAWSGWSGPLSERGVGLVLVVPLELLVRTPPETAALVRTSAGAPSLPALIDTATTATPADLSIPPRDLRKLVKAAWKAAGLSPEEARLADLASRARTSAALPELRLKVVRTLDQSLRLTPTDADPYRVQTGDGAGMLYEARATWRLDRLVFADDEVAIERLRVERNEQRLKLTLHVIESVAAWQKAHARATDPTASPDERAEATVKEIVAAAALDALTDGAWSRRDEPEEKRR